MKKYRVKEKFVDANGNVIEPQNIGYANDKFYIQCKKGDVEIPSDVFMSMAENLTWIELIK